MLLSGASLRVKGQQLLEDATFRGRLKGKGATTPGRCYFQGAGLRVKGQQLLEDATFRDKRKGKGATTSGGSYLQGQA